MNAVLLKQNFKPYMVARPQNGGYLESWGKRIVISRPTWTV